MFEVTPEIVCKLTYSCNYLSGPVDPNTIDMCNFVQGDLSNTDEAVQIQFDCENDQCFLLFNVADAVTVPPGVYEYELVAEIADSSYTRPFTIEVIDPCPYA